LTISNSAPVVTLNNPPDATSNESKNHIFDSSLSDIDGDLINATLYHNLQGTWVANQTVTISGATNTTNFSVANIPPGTYIWNVQVCDASNVCRQAGSNFTLIVGTSCGDGIITGSEICDGTNLSGNTCVGYGFEGGTLRCKADCSAHDTTVCSTINPNAFQPEFSGSIPPELVYDADKYDNFDFVANKVILVKIKLKNKLYSVNVDELEPAAAKLKITASPAVYYDFKEGQTIPIDMDKDGESDLYFKFSDKLTRRAAFTVNRFTSLAITGRTVIEEVKEPEQEVNEFTAEAVRIEIPQGEYLAAVLLLVLIMLVVIFILITVLGDRMVRKG
ncbi:MAG: hypothetical protein Q8R00_05120, partial [Candidatus Nanoarchaeia archaeon]|nr:hypothetical protein [Candidatus Nanoarchaeia archaeon]